MAERSMVLLTTYIRREQREALQRLSRRTRVRQSEYIREAIDDLLAKYGEAEASAEAGVELAVVAAQTGLSARTLRRYLREGRLKGEKVGGRWRVDAASLERLLGKVT